ncbi:glycosyltransferase family 4 protein [Streptococcus suis]|uniref:glycosyltransferase family 4 protein n=1 Tax=Streptococcus suis TaxID=1307 RepID=UPI002FC81AC0
MNVLFISPTGTLDNGAEISIVNLMKYLSEVGINVHNVFPESQHSTSQKYTETMLEYGIVGHPVSTVQWWWEEAPNSKDIRPDLLSFSYQHAVSKIRQIIRDKEIDLVISNTVNVFQGAVAAACEDVRHIYLIHEFPFGEFEYYKHKIEFIDQYSDAIYAVKGELFNNLSNYFSKEKLKEFIPYSAVKYYENIVGEETRIVSIGKLTERKNQLELITAYHKLGRPDIPLVFIGAWEENYKQKCDLYIQNNELNNVHFLGYQKEPWSLVTDQDICVFTSKLETFGLVYIEALLNAIPTIISNNPGHLSVFDIFQNGTLYPLGDCDSLVIEINRLIEEFSFYKAKARAVVEEYRKFYKVQNVYKTLILDITLEQVPVKKSLRDINFLLDFSISKKEFLNRLQNQVSIYFSTEEQPFFEENKKVYQLRYEDKIEIFIDDNITELRVDLSELPSIYSDVRVSIAGNDNYLNPIQSNGLQYKNGYIFLELDPYLVYDVRAYAGKTACIEYASVMSGNLASSDGTEILESIRNKFQAVEILKESLKERERELEKVRQDYQTIVTSRRWIIPTKIINFFRRKR